MFQMNKLFKSGKRVFVKSENISNHVCSLLIPNKSNSSYRTPDEENPIRKTLKVLNKDMRTVKAYLTNEEANDSSIPSDFPYHCDIVVIGGGIIGSSIAYWLKQRAPRGISVAVVEKDPTYAKASTVLSSGGLRQQFSLEENIKMSLFGADFLRNIKKHLFVKGHSVPDVQFTPCGYLFLASEKGAQQLEENARLQTHLGAKVELLSTSKIKKKFPWMNVDGIEIGCHGLENEGSFDPWSLLDAFKKKSISLGTDYVKAEAVGFEFKSMQDILMDGIEPGSFEGLDKLLVKMDTGEIRSIKFAIAVIAAGANSGVVAKMARIGNGKGLLETLLPVEPRKRYVYCFNCQNGPGLNTPFLIDHTGMYCRREGLGGNYITGMSPTLEQEPSVDNLEVDYNFFEEHVWPRLASRIPAFESIKVKGAWAGYYDYNVFDENGVVGPHPYYHNLYIATGFSGHGLQHAPAVGRAVMEMILDGDFQTINLERMNFDRLFLSRPLKEQNIV